MRIGSETRERLAVRNLLDLSGTDTAKIENEENANG